jgi:hypothetical protein
MGENKLTSVSKSTTEEQIAAFWDSHDFTDFDTDAPDVEVTVTCAVPIEVDLFAAIEQQAHRHGVKVETLVNLWLQQKLAEQAGQAPA